MLNQFKIFISVTPFSFVLNGNFDHLTTKVFQCTFFCYKCRDTSHTFIAENQLNPTHTEKKKTEPNLTQCRVSTSRRKINCLSLSLSLSIKDSQSLHLRQQIRSQVFLRYKTGTMIFVATPTPPRSCQAIEVEWEVKMCSHFSCLSVDGT